MAGLGVLHVLLLLPGQQLPLLRLLGDAAADLLLLVLVVVVQAAHLLLHHFPPLLAIHLLPVVGSNSTG
jgi:hypothetical protein